MSNKETYGRFQEHRDNHISLNNLSTPLIIIEHPLIHLKV